MKIFGNKICPKCGARVKYRYFITKPWSWAKWNCFSCNQLLGYNSARRTIAAVIAGLLSAVLTPLLFILYISNAWLLLPAIILFLISFTAIEGIESKQ